MRDLKIKYIFHGHWEISIVFRGKEYKKVTTNSKAIDDYNSDDLEKDGRELRKKRGFKDLRNEVIRAHQLK